jgi:serine/threonine protein kinase/HD-like signal output (HDOD) protein
VNHPTTLEELLPNTQLGHYTILAHVAEGGMGHVYRAFEPSLQREVAIKVLKEDLASNPKYRRFFETEAMNIAALRHGNIVPIYYVGSQGDLYYFVMPFIEGSTLDDWVESEMPMNTEQATWVLRNGVEALDWALKHDIVHLDIKPSNFLVDHSGAILLTDFGLAKSLGEGSGPDITECFGTPAYISPEQIMRQPADQRSDIYSFGATLFHLMTTTFLHDGETVESIIMGHLDQPFPYSVAEKHGLSPGWINLLDRMTQKRPEDRFQNYDEIRTALTKVEYLPPVAFRSTEKDAGPMPVPIRGSETKESLFGILHPSCESWAEGGVDAGLAKSRDEIIELIVAPRRPLDFSKLVPALKELAEPMDGDLEDMVQTMQMLPEFRRFILALANTSFCRGQEEAEITDNKKALKAVGKKLSRNLLLTCLIIREQPRGMREFIWLPLWQHSIAVGLVATFLIDFIAEEASEEDARQAKKNLGKISARYFHKMFSGNIRDQAYVCGFLHDIGKIILGEAAAYPAYVSMRQSIERLSPLDKEEAAVFGVDHREAGALWLKQQNFDVPLRDSAWYHHEGGPKMSPVASAVAVANQIVKRYGIGFSGNGVVEYRNFTEMPAWAELKKHFKNTTSDFGSVESKFMPLVGELPVFEAAN